MNPFNSVSDTSLLGLHNSESLSAALGSGLALAPSNVGLFSSASHSLQNSSTVQSDWFVDRGDAPLANTVRMDWLNGTTTLNASAPSDWYISQGDDNLATATHLHMGWLDGARTINNFVGVNDLIDVYSFAIGQNSTVNLSLTGMSNDADFYLIRDFNNNQSVDANEVLDFSGLSGKAAETIDVNLVAGFYHIAVKSAGANTHYSLNVSAVELGRTQRLIGDLEANQFVVNPTATRSVFSGNGNIDFGLGQFDYIDASSIHSSAVVNWNLAGINGSGVAYDDGTGTRVFDAITLRTGQQILFEGMDTIQFADTTLPINVLSVIPNDPGFAQQWNLHMMGVHNAWRFTTGSDKVAIGIADTGLGFDALGNIHSDLQRPNVFFNRGNSEDDFFRATPDGGPQSTSHGTAVHGVIGAKTNNGEGISGINWNSTIMNVDVLDANAGDYLLEHASQITINSAIARDEKLIINMSLGGNNMHPDAHRKLEQVIAQNPNTLFVIAAGNEGQELAGLASPAVLAQAYANVIAVGASWGSSDQFGKATNPGQRIVYDSWGSQYGPGLTVMGPSEVMSTMAENTLFGTKFGYHQHNALGEAAPNREFDGTSAAAPNVSGVASLVWSANSNLSAGQIKQILSETAYRNIPGYNPTEYGNGFVNADAAVRRAIAMA
jgi:serine protease